MKHLMAYHGNFQQRNRGKRGMTLDLKHPRVKEVMERLVKWVVLGTRSRTTRKKTPTL